jgi:hypothetical protein
MAESPLELDDFSGGMTDTYVAGPMNKYEVANNLVIVKHGDKGKLLMRPGSVIYNSTAYLIPTGNQRIGSLLFFIPAQTLLVHSARSIYYIASNAYHELVGPTSNKLFPSGVGTTNYSSYATWNNHLFVANDSYQVPSKIYMDGSSNLQLRTAGMPALASSPTITPTANTGKSFLYRFIYYYTYTVGTVTFEDFGPTTEVLVSNADAPNTNKNAITAIPVLANSTTFNYDTTNVKVKIYRTENQGTAFYYVNQVSNGTTTYDDVMSDATLVTHEPLYTEGGVVDNDPPPPCKFVHVTEDNVGVYANIKEGSQILSNRVRFSIPGDIDSAPASFFEDTDQEITGLSSFRSRTIVLCQYAVYRFEGYFDEQGNGSVQKTKISDTAGCVSGGGVVKTLEGVFWAGNDGFYYTDGLTVLKISEDIDETTYKDLVSSATKKARIVGKYDTKNRRVYWTVTTADGTENNGLFILDLKWGISPNMPFTTASGEGTSFRPTCIEFENTDLLRGDSRGYVFRHQDVHTTDPLVDTSLAASAWFEKTIIWNYKSCAMNFGTNYVRKLVTRIVAVLKNITNVSVQINTINDDGRKISSLKPIRFRGNVTWGDSDVVWGDQQLSWDFDGLIIQQRRMPAGSLRCSYKQIEITNAFVDIVNSDVIGLITVDSAAKTATLESAAVSDWPTQAVDYYIAFEQDGYSREFQVLTRSADTITFLDAGNNCPSGGGIQWVLRGYPKGEVLNLLSYTLDYTLFGKSQDNFKVGEDGEVGDA